MGKSSETTADRVSVKLPPGKAKKMAEAVALVTEHYGALLAVWRELTPGQRARALEHCPVAAPLFRALGE
jgi:hypothetical protein